MTIVEKFEEIVKRCKGEVALTANGHRSSYLSLEDAIANPEPGVGGPPEPVEEPIARRIRATDNFYRLQFYPDSPVGFHLVVGGSLEDVVEQACQILADNGGD
jgi:hypothetical protein